MARLKPNNVSQGKLKSTGYTGEPTGTIEITENGIHNVKQYASASVDVEPNLESKEVTINENTTTLIEPSEGKDGLSNVTITTNVSLGNVKMIQFTPEVTRQTIQIEVPKMPWAIMIDCGTDLAIAGFSNYVVTRYISVYTRYGSGGFVGTRVCGTAGNGTFEHYQVTNPTYSNGILTLYAGSCRWGNGRTYTMYYVDEEITQKRELEKGISKGYVNPEKYYEETDEKIEEVQDETVY